MRRRAVATMRRRAVATVRRHLEKGPATERPATGM